MHFNVAFTQEIVDGKCNRNISVLQNLRSYLVTLLLVILFIIILYARINVYKQGQDVIKNVRLYEHLKTKSMKLKAGIIYIKSCKKEELLPIFAKVYLAITSGGFKIKKDSA